MRKFIKLLIVTVLFVFGCGQREKELHTLTKDRLDSMIQEKSEDSVTTKPTFSEAVKKKSSPQLDTDIPQKSGDSVTAVQIFPETEPKKPHPQLSPEEREKLIQATEKESPEVDNNPPSPSGLPLETGEKTKIETLPVNK